MNQRDMVLLNFPYSDFSAGKVRPALVVSNDTYNSRNMDVVVCAVTSNLEQKEFSVIVSQSDVSAGKLPVQSKIRADKLFQVHKSLAMKPFASLNQKKFSEVVTQIQQLVSSSP